MRGLIDYQEISAGCRDSATGTHDSMSLAFNPLLITYVVTWTDGPSAYPANNRAGRDFSIDSFTQPQMVRFRFYYGSDLMCLFS